MKQFTNLEDNVYFGEDEYTNHWREHHARWCARLNDDRIVYQDDNRPGCTPHDGWSRLKQYCEDSGQYIKHFWLQFRSNSVQLPTDQEGYMFVKMVRGWIGGDSIYYYLCGYINNQNLIVHKYKIPELLIDDVSHRDLDKYDLYTIRKKE